MRLWAGHHISAWHKQFCLLAGERLNEQNRFSCCIKYHHSALQGDLCGQLQERLMLWLTYLLEWMRCFSSFADIGDHTPIIITMVIYTSLCKCVLVQERLSGPPHISFVFGRMVSMAMMGRINSRQLRYHCLSCEVYALKDNKPVSSS